MSPQAEEKINQIHELLLGDATKGKLGLIHGYNQVREDLYGIDPDGRQLEGKKNHILKRVSKLEDSQKKVWWIVTGICTAFAAIKLGFTELVAKVFER